MKIKKVNELKESINNKKINESVHNDEVVKMEIVPSDFRGDEIELEDAYMLITTKLGKKYRVKIKKYWF